MRRFLSACAIIAVAIALPAWAATLTTTGGGAGARAPASGLSAFSITYAGRGTQALGTSTSHVVAAVPIGANCTGSDVCYVVVAFGSNNSTGAVESITAVTFDAVPVTAYYGVTGVNGKALSGIAYLPRASLPDPSQTDIDVAITMDAAVSATDAFGYKMVNPGSGTPTAHVTDNADSSGLLDVSLTIASGGKAVAAAYCFTCTGPDGSSTWTGLTEDFDALVHSGTASWMSTASGGTGTGSTVTVTDQFADTTISGASGTAVSWAP